MMMDTPQITVYSSMFERIAPINFFESMKIVDRYDELSTMELVLSGNHDRIPNLIEPGARLVVDYGGRQLFSGPVRGVTGKGPSSSSTVTVTAEGDNRLLWRMLLWPATNVTPSGEAGVVLDREYRSIKAPAETVAKTLIGENCDRMVSPISVAPDKRRGPTVAASVRFHTFADRVLPLMSAAGMRVSVSQGDGELVADCVPTMAVPHVFSEESGTIEAWEFTRSAPKATRVIVGGSGEGKARLFTMAEDSDLHEEWADCVEVFTDARNSDSQKVTLLDEARQTLAESKPTSGFKITLSDRVQQLLGAVTMRPGDEIIVHVAGVDVVERIKEIEYVCDDPGSGWTRVTPVAGEFVDDPSRALASKIADMSSNIRYMRTL